MREELAVKERERPHMRKMAGLSVRGGKNRRQFAWRVRLRGILSKGLCMPA